jgi:transposase
LLLATKTPEQQSCLMLHRTRHLFIRHQTSVINAIRARLAEFGNCGWLLHRHGSAMHMSAVKGATIRSSQTWGGKSAVMHNRRRP